VVTRAKAARTAKSPVFIIQNMLRFQKFASRVCRATFPVCSESLWSLRATPWRPEEPRFALVQSFDFIYKSIVEPEPPEVMVYSRNASRRGRKMRFKVVMAVLCALTILSSVYAFRQREWALKLRDQLAETNKDDVKLMNILSPAEKETICRKFREHGENRIAEWITRQYLVTQEADETLISQEAK
jgi:hypothetical protein